MSAPRFGDRALFPKLEARAYLAHAAISPVSTPVADAVAATMDRYARRGAGAFGPSLALRDRVRAALARLIGADPDELAFTSGTSAALTAVAQGFPWPRGARVICFDGEVPANVTPWQQAAARHGLELLMHRAEDFRGGGPGLARLEAALERGGVALVAVSAVQFQTGLKMPLAAMARACRAHGAALCVDAIQAVGITPLDVRAAGADFVAGGAHKWLMGIEGAGYLWCHPRWRERLRPVVAGWLSLEAPVSFLVDAPLTYDRPVVGAPRFLEGGTQAMVALAALEASVALLTALGVEAIADHAQRYIDALTPQLEALGFAPLGPMGPDERAGTLAMRLPPDIAPAELGAALAEVGVIVSTPEGCLRVAPHWPNALEEVDVVVDAVTRALEALRAR